MTGQRAWVSPSLVQGATGFGGWPDGLNTRAKGEGTGWPRGGGDALTLVYDLTKESASTNISLAVASSDIPVRASVDWGDGTTELWTTTGTKSHLYKTTGTYVVRITGTLRGFTTSAGANKLTDCLSWGNTGLTKFSFSNAINLRSVPKWLPKTLTSLNSAFLACESFNQNLNTWDVSRVTDFNKMFKNCVRYNQPLDQWNTAKVTDLNSAFYGCTDFNQNLNSWNTSRVYYANDVFYGCTSFNQPLDQWDMSRCTTISNMFVDCVNFDQPLNTWNVSQVISAYTVFAGCHAFNQPLDQWRFNSGLQSLQSMFSFAYSFNQPLNSWVMTNVRSTGGMFAGSGFNQPLDQWDTSSLVDVREMFYASPFNQDISNWDFSKIVDASIFLSNISPQNYDKILNKAASQDVQPGVPFTASAQYTAAGAAAHAHLETVHGWQFADDGQVP